MKGRKVKVIGAGISGLAIAARLASRGASVDVLEASGTYGGKMGTWQDQGFTFDTGPSLFTRPELIDEVLELPGSPAPTFSYEKLENITNYFFPDGTELSASASLDKFAETIAENTADSKRSILKFFERALKIDQITEPIFLNKPVRNISTFLNPKAIAALSQISPRLLSSSMHEYHVRSFKDPKTVQLFDRFATYNGSNPYKAPAILQVIPVLEHIHGAYFPEAGMASIAKSLFEKGQSLGVNYRFNNKVEEIIIRENTAAGIRTESGEEFSEYVVSNMDVRYTYERLLRGKALPAYLAKNDPSSSALIFLWGIDRRFAQLDLHNLFFSGNYEKEFEDLFHRKTINPDPTVYVNISSKHKVSDAPRESENWFVMVNAPYNAGQNWEEMITKTRANVIRKLNQRLNIDLDKLIITEKINSPIYLQEETFAYRGALYGDSHNHALAAFRRHPNSTKQIKDLFFCGGTVHPGGGIPLCMLSAKIVDNLIAS